MGLVSWFRVQGLAYDSWELGSGARERILSHRGQAAALSSMHGGSDRLTSDVAEHPSQQQPQSLWHPSPLGWEAQGGPFSVP